MTAIELLALLNQQGVVLSVDGTDLRISAPAGSLTDELKSELRSHKAELLELLDSTQQGAAAVDLTGYAGQPPRTDIPLSFAQERLWFLDQLEPGNTQYNLPTALRLSGELNRDALQTALDALLLRHEVLRTVFVRDGREARARVQPDLRCILTTDDARALAANELAAELTRLSNLPFALATGPLLRAHLLRTSAQEHVLLLVAHHIVTDGISLGVLMQELAEFYRAALGRSGPASRKPQAHYADYAAWQREHLQGAALDRLVRHWRGQLAGAPLRLDLPTDHARPAKPSYRGAWCNELLPPDRLTALRALARTHGATLYTLLLTAFAALLHRYTRQSDLLIGSPVAGRQLSATETMPGLFVNSVVIRAQVEPTTSFADLLVQVTQTTLDALSHQALPFEKLVEALAPERDAAVAPVFQVLFNMQNRESERRDFAGLTAQPVVVETGTAKLDLSVLVEDRSDGLAVWFEYSTDLFTAATAQQMLGHYCLLLEGLLANPAQRVAAMPLLTPAERSKIVLDWNATAVDYPAEATLISLFERQVEQTPEATALTYAAETLSYQELNQRVNQLAHHLRDIGVVPDQMVGVLLERSVDMVVALYGILKAGGAYVPLDPDYPPTRLQQILDDAGIGTVLTHSRLAAGLPTHAARVINVNIGWDAIAIANCPRKNPQLRAAPHHAAYAIFTSGSTGRPKGVVNEHRGIVNRLLWMQDTFCLEPSDVVLQKTPFSFDVSVWEFFWPLLSGAQLVLARPGGHKDVGYLLELIKTTHITTLHFVPAMLELFLQQQEVAECTSIRRVISSGEALSIELQRQFFARINAELHNLYGPTEAAVDVTWWRCDPNDTGARVPIGRPIANTQIYLVDEDSEPVPPGLPGELLIGGVQVARGYLKQPELTAERFIADRFSATPHSRIYRTGDLARYRHDGVIEYLGRNDFQLKLRGLRIEPGEIEAALLRMDAIAQATVVLRTDGDADPRLVAYYVSHDGNSLSEDTLRSTLAATLPDYMVPASFVRLSELPVTSNGKLDRQALPAPAWDTAADPDYQPPRTPQESALCEIFAAVLQRGQVGIHDDFFRVGGHSLLATRTVVRISETLNTDVSLQQLFDCPTVAELSAALELSPGSERLPAIAPRSGASLPPLSAAQQRLWILEQIAPGNPAYSIPWATRLTGSLDVPALQQALHQLVTRHESLRTVFRLAEGRPAQQIVAPADAPVALAQLTVAADELRATLTRLSQKPFDFENGPLLRLTLLKLGDDEHVLHVVMHHIIGDAWSTAILQRDLAALYNAATQAETARLPELPVQYADFALWQQDLLKSATGAQTLDFWMQHLRGAPTALELPTDQQRPARLGHAGAWHPMSLTPELTSQLKQLSDAHNVTLFMLLFAAFNVLLSRYSQQQDIVVGTPVAGRSQSALENLIGVFINTLPLRTQLQGDQPFAELLATVKSTSLAAFEHQNLAFEQLVETLQPERDTSRAPVFQVMFILQNAPADQSTLHGLEHSPVLFDFGSAKLDLTLSMEERDDTLVSYLEYNAELFTPATIERLLQHFATLLDSIASNPATPVAELALLPAAERQQILVEWNETALDYPAAMTLHSLFAEQAARRPDAVALTHGDDNFSYRELNRRANKLARHLQANGVGTETLVAVCTERTPAMIVALLAIHKAGGAYVPVDPEYPAQRIAHMLSDSAAPLLLTQTELLPHLPTSDGDTLCLDQFDWTTTTADDAGPDAAATAANLAYVIYTSGSTGTPKGVEVEHRNAVALAQWAGRVFTADELAGVLASTSICFDLSVFEIFVTLGLGGRLVLVRDALDVPELAPDSRVTLINTVPSAMAELVRIGKLPASIITVTLCGEPLSTALVNSIYALGDVKRVYDLYGPTEDTVYSTWTLRGRDAAPNIGRPIYNTQAYVLDPRGEPTPIGVPGELLLSGTGVTRGYRGQPELTAERFVANPVTDAAVAGTRCYRTGDQVRWRDDGTLEFRGRLDHQVKLRGYRIELGEIETVLGEHDAVENTVVIVREDQADDPRLVAYLVLAGESGPNVIAELRDACGARLPGYMIPAHLVVLDALPLTPNGKLDRKALPPPAPSSDATVEYVAPRSPIETALAERWAELLGVEQVGIHDDFFALGGHSLLAIQIVSYIRDSFAADVPILVMFSAPTVAELAAWVKQHSVAEAMAGIPVCPRDGPLPLSFAQQRLWFLAQLSPGDPVYNLPWVIKLKGTLDTTALRAAFDSVVRRHEALRTVFPDAGGAPVQLILQEPDIALQETDGREWSPADIQRHLSELANQPLNLARGPLFHASLLQTAADEHIFAFVVHHIVYDAWSHTLVMRDLTSAYNAARCGQPITLPRPAVEFADYAAWQRDWLSSEEHARQLAYWQQQLQGAPGQLALPTDHPRPEVQRSSGATYSRMLAPDTHTQMTALAAAAGASLFTTLLAAFNILLSRYSGQTDLLVGTPISGRKRSELEEIVGFFLHTLVLRADLTGDPSFAEVLERTRTTVYAAFEHQELPFETLVEALAAERDTSRHPLFQVYFVLQHMEIDWEQFDGLSASLVDVELDAAKFDITFSVIDANDQLSVRLEYNTDLFEAATVERLVEHFDTLLGSIAANPAQPVAQLAMLPKAEQQQLRDFNDTAVSYPGDATLVSLFEQQVARTPDAVALVIDEHELSYSKLNARINQLAHHLIAAGIGPEVRVGVHLERSPEFIVALYAVLKAGGAYVPLDPDYPQQRLLYMLEDAQPQLVISATALAEQLPGVSLPILLIDALAAELDAEATTNPALRSAPSDLAYVIFTSGSTGRPKGVMNEHRGICNRLLWMQQTFELTAADRLLQKTPYSFDVSVWELFWPLQTGATLVLARPGGHRDPQYLAELINTQSITTVHFVPAMLQAFLQEPAAASCGSLRKIMCSGEALSVELQNRCLSTFDAELHNQYGPTEAAVEVLHWQCRQLDGQSSVPLGRPGANTQIYIVEAGGALAPLGVPGELWIGGVQVARGYINQPELTAAQFVADPFSDAADARAYRTGDLARVRADGVIEFLGRIDQQIKLRGFRIELQEIEAVLDRLPDVKQSAVMLREDLPDDPRLTAYVVPVASAAAAAADGDTETLHEQLITALREQLAAELPDYMVPSYFVVLDRFPLTASGKTDRRALPAPERRSDTHTYIAPRTELEAQLAELWSTTLDVEPIGVNDNFFTLGGHSLLATQLVSRIRDALQVELPLLTLFNSPTIAGIASSLATTQPQADTHPLTPRDRSAPLPLSFAQQRLWFLHELEGPSSTYTIPLALHLSSDIDMGALQAAVDGLVARHESLRTRFVAHDGKPEQVILASDDIRVDVINVPGANRAAREATAETLAQQPFDLSTALLRVHLLRATHTENTLLIVLHHIITDGWSTGILARELASLYAAAVADQPAALPELPLQYADYALWQREWLSGAELQRQLLFWEEQLRAAPPLQLQTDRARPPAQTFNGALLTRTFDVTLSKQLRSLAETQDCTLFMLLLAAYATLLARYTATSDIVVGSPIAGRTRTETEGLIGLFVNTLALRIELDEAPDFLTLLKRVKAVALRAFAHQELPFEKLVEELRPERDTSQPPLVQTLFALQDNLVDTLNFGGSDVLPINLHLGGAKFDLSLFVLDHDSGLIVSLEYNTDLFEAATVERLVEHFDTLLGSIAANPAQPVAQLAMLPKAEQQQLRDFNDTAVSYPGDATLVSLFEQQVARTPDAVALVIDEHELSYSKLNARINQLAHHLIAAGIGPEVRVGVHLERSPEFIVALYAVLKAGGAYVPLDPDYPQQRLLYMLEDAQPQLVISATALAEQLPGVSLPILLIDALAAELDAEATTNPALRSAPSDLAYVIFTSGSTGRPKGVMNEHRGICNRLLWMQQTFELTAADRLLQKTPYSFDVSVWELFWPLQTGATLVLARPGGHRDPQYLAELINTQSITTVHFVPAMLQAFLQEPAAASCGSLRKIMCSGEALSVELQNRCLSTFDAELHNQYGPTEAAVEVLHWQCRQLDGQSSVPLGRPGANTQIYIVEAGGALAPLGVPGELWIGGVQVARGYINQPELTAAQFVADPFSDAADARAYRTGDLARVRADGVIEFLGRIDQQIKLRGFRIELQEIEAVLDRLPDVKQSAVMLREDLPDDPRLTAYVVPVASAAAAAADGDTETLHEQLITALREQLAAELPDYMVPSYFVVLDRFPLTASGKTDRRALPAPERRSDTHTYIAPRTELEAQLAELWSTTLDVEPIGVNDNFFTLGGHSLLATQLVSRIRDALQVELPLLTLFNSPTIAGIASSLATTQPQADTHPLTPRDRSAPLPLSFAQQRLWFLNQLEPGNPVYNLPWAMELTGPLDFAGLQSTFDALIARHESLRTTFVTALGKPQQRVISSATLPLTQSDARGASPEEVLRRLRELARQPFELEQYPLLRVHVLRTAEDQHIVLIVMHHIIADGWSIGVLYREWAELYAAYCSRQPARLNELAVQYPDFALWQQDWLESPACGAQLEYWRQRLAGAPELLELPTDRPRGPSQTYNGACVEHLLPAALHGQLQQLARAESATLFMVCLAAFNVLLSRYSDQDDICVGAPVAGRRHSELDDLIGCFINTLVMRNDLSGSPSFAECIRRVKQTALAAFAHQDLPFEQLVDELHPVRDMSHAPLFQVAFVMQNTPWDAATRLQGLEVKAFDLDYGVAKFDLSLMMAEREDGLLAYFEYNSDLFDAATIQRLAGHFETLLTAASAAPETPALQLPLLSAAERQQSLCKWNDTASPFEDDTCIQHLIEAQAAQQPTAIAIRYGAAELTYAELNQQANQIAHWLIAAGAGSGSIVGLCVERSPQLIAALLGILKSGAAYLPLDPDYPNERLEWMLTDSQTGLLVTQHAMLASLPPHSARTLRLDSDAAELSRQPDNNPENRVDAAGLAYVIYTSGSTGQPKGVLIEHRGVCNLAHAQASVFGLGPGDRMLQFASISFDASIFEIVMGLSVGATLVVAAADELLPGAPLLKLLEEQRVTAVTLPPTALLQLPPAELPHLHTITVAGEDCPADLVARWTRGDSQRHFFNLYGPTEATVWASYAECHSGQPVTIGTPISNARLYVLDAWQEPVPPGVPGELYIGGAGLARGYLNQPELSAARFTADHFVAAADQRMYRTGDRVRRRADGALEFLGRMDAQVKVRGFRIELGEIEAALAAHPAVREAVVIARGTSVQDRQLVAYLVCVGATPALSELRSHLRQRLPDFMVPATYVALDELPLTPNRKIDRAALPDPRAQRLTHDQDYTAPRTPQEAVLAEIWCKILQAEQVGVNDNFFELGGDSILSIQIIARAAQEGLKLTPKQVFQHQTIAELAAAASTERPIDAEQALVTGPVPLTPIQRWFAGRNVRHPQHFNQSQLLLSSAALDPALLEQALQLLVTHHDSLRLRIQQQTGFWRQTQSADIKPRLLRVLNLEQLDRSAQERHQQGLANALQADIDLAQGPLLRALLFKRGDPEQDRLLVVVHHMAVDWVSWPILLADLETAYTMLQTGQTPALPRKTTSFKAWAERLEQFAAEPGLQAEYAWWVEQDWDSAAPIPTDVTTSAGPRNNGAGTRAIGRALTSVETQQLLHALPKIARSRVDEVLLTAIAQAACDCTGSNMALLDLEGHGREDLFDDVDLSRTVGWFTTLYPALLQVPADASAAATLHAIKTQLRAIPRRGLSFGVLRYLSRTPEVRTALDTIPTPQIGFNYLGRFEQLADSDALLRPTGEPRGRESSRQAERAHQLEVAGLIADEQLQLSFEYSADLHAAETIERFADRTMMRLRELLAVARSDYTALVTPADFPLAGLDTTELTALVTATGDVEDIYRLTPLQHGMLFHSLLGGDRDIYLARFRWRLAGSLDAELFAQAWQQAAQRNPSLRAAFAWQGLTTPVQIIHRDLSVELQREDWSELAQPLQQQRLQELLEADRNTGFDFEQAPLMRLRLIRLAADDHQFIWTFHHAIADGWSVPLVLQEVLGCYDALCSDTPFAAPQRAPFSEYVRWLDAQDTVGAAAHWRRYLAGFSVATPLPLAATLATDAAGEGELITQLPTESVVGLRALAADLRITLNTIVQAAWGLLLARYSGRDDVVFGATTSGRPADMPGVANMVGLFLNTLPVRVRIPHELTVAEWLNALQAEQLEARQYEFSSLAEVQGWSAIPRGTPLFNSLLAFENYPDMETMWTDTASIRIREVEGFDRTNFPLTVNVAVFDTLQMRLVFDQQQLNHTAAGRIAAAFKLLLEQIGAAPERPLQQLTVLSDAERDWLLHDWNATARAYPAAATLPQLFEAQVERTPAAQALLSGTYSLSYAELNRRVNRLAHYLITAGVGPDTPVGVYMDRSIDMVIALYAIVKAGGAYVPLDPEYPAQRLAHMLEDAELSWVLTEAAIAAQLPDSAATLICVDELTTTLANSPTHNPTDRARPDSLAYVIFTSGSTGRPKGVMNEHRGICNRLLWMQDEYALGATDRVLQKTPYSFDVSVWELFWPLQTGAALVLAKPGGHRDSGYLCELIAAQKVTTAHFVPSMLQVFLEHPNVIRANTLQRVICSGETLTTALQSKMLHTLDAELYNLYGPTEAAVDVTHWRCVPETDAGSVPIGRPVANTQIYIVDEHGGLAARGAKGEIWIGGTQVARGYIKQPELTAERFLPDPFAPLPGARVYRTGDLGRLRDDGALEFLGRVDAQIKLRGFRIELGDIEAALSSLEHVRQSAVALREDTPGDPRLVAYITTTADLDPDALLTALRTQLPGYMVPSMLLILAELPVTANGKLDRARLPAPEQRQPQGFAAPRNTTEETLAAIWAETLRVDQVGIHDDFFALGGHSLIAMQLVSRIVARLQVQLPLDALFERPTVAGLAESVARAHAHPTAPAASTPIARTSKRQRRRRKQ